MNTVDKRRLPMDGPKVSVGGQVIEVESEKEQDPLIFVDLEDEDSSFGSIKVQLIGEELEQLLKGHRYSF
jgi:hypothetical protein